MASKPCANAACRQWVEHDWKVCPECGTPQHGRPVAPTINIASPPSPTKAGISARFVAGIIAIIAILSGLAATGWWVSLSHADHTMERKLAVVDERVKQYNDYLSQVVAIDHKASPYQDKSTAIFDQKISIERRYEGTSDPSGYITDSQYNALEEQEHALDDPLRSLDAQKQAILSEALHVLDDLKTFDVFHEYYNEQSRDGYRFYVRRN